MVTFILSKIKENKWDLSNNYFKMSIRNVTQRRKENELRGPCGFAPCGFACNKTGIIIPSLLII